MFTLPSFDGPELTQESALEHRRDETGTLRANGGASLRGSALEGAS